MRPFGLLILVAAGYLVAAEARSQGPAEGNAPQIPGAGGRSLEQEVAALRERVRYLQQRLAQLEGRLAAAPNPAARSLGRVREIIVFGNTKTPELVILAQLPFKPGDSFSQADLQLAVRKLELLGIFVVDPARGIRPSVKCIIDPRVQTVYRDILVQIEEK